MNSLGLNKKPNQTISQITASGCKPTISYRGEKRCTELMHYAFEQVIPSGKYDKIIISARWKMDDLSWLLRTLDQIEGTRAEVTVFGPIIEYTQPLPRILAHSDHEEKLVRTRKYEEVSQVDSSFKQNLLRKDINYVSLVSGMCRKKLECKTLIENKPMQFDYGHLTKEASEYLILELNFL